MKYRKTTDEELALILEEAEGYTLEFKRDINSDLPKELVAFANASGGRILIGVNDQNQVVGCDLSNKRLAQMEDMAAACDPPVPIGWEITSQSTQRKEILELPEVALREAVVNAVCHRDYLEKGAQVMVEIFDDRVEIYNPGGLPKGLPADELGKRSVCRNPLIASLLLRCNYIEKMGTGIERIRAALRKERCPKVKIRFNTLFILEFPRPTYVKQDEPQKETSGKTSGKILELFEKNKSITIPELSEAIDVTPRSIERNLKNLQTQGRIRRVGPAKGGRWEIVNDK